jgi:hypothetical protein
MFGKLSVVKLTAMAVAHLKLREVLAKMRSLAICWLLREFRDIPSTWILANNEH